MKKIVLIGYGGHAESIIDSIKQAGVYEIVGYTDLKKADFETDYPYLGNDDVLADVYSKGVDSAAICIGYLGQSDIRDRLYEKVKRIGFRLPCIVDKTAALAADVLIEDGSYVGKGAIVNSKSKIGKMCIVNSGAVVEHGNRVGDFSHVSVGAVLCGNVMVGDHVFVGANATVVQGVNIQAYSSIGAGTIVLKDVPDNTKVYGIWNGK